MMAIITSRKSFRIRLDRLESMVEFRVKTLCRLDVSFGVPRQSLRVVTLRGGRNDKFNHRDRLDVGLALESPTKMRWSSGRHQVPWIAVVPRLPKHHLAASNHRAK